MKLLKYRKNSKPDRTPLVITYSKGLPNLHHILRKHQCVLYKSDRMKKVFENTPMVAYCRDKNLQDILVHSKYNKMYYSKPNGSSKCERKCVLCPHIIESQSFSDNQGNSYNIQGHIDCKTADLVYAIYCAKCQKYVYVGETGCTLYQRMLLNFSRIRTGYPDPVAQHFRDHGHCTDDLKVIGIEKNHGDDVYRGVKEHLWIKKLNTFKPNGINTKE